MFHGFRYQRWLVPFHIDMNLNFNTNFYAPKQPEFNMKRWKNLENLVKLPQNIVKTLVQVYRALSEFSDSKPLQISMLTSEFKNFCFSHFFFEPRELGMGLCLAGLLFGFWFYLPTTLHLLVLHQMKEYSTGRLLKSDTFPNR